MTRDEAKNQIETTCGQGWLPLVDKAFDHLPHGVAIVEAFEKYGRLKFRIDRDDEAFETFLDEITERSGMMCEVCGEAGTEQIANRWISTLCERHFVERTAGADSGGSDGASW